MNQLRARVILKVRAVTAMVVVTFARLSRGIMKMVKSIDHVNSGRLKAIVQSESHIYQL